MSNNGKKGQHAPNGAIIRRIVCDSGVEIDVAPVSPHAVAKIRQRAADVHPLPDLEQFRKPVENAAIEGDTYLDKNDPEYKRLVLEASRAQAEFIFRAIADITFSYPRGREQLIEDFRPRMQAMRAYMELPEDEWEATFWYGIIGSHADSETLTQAAMSVLPISMEEVVDGEHGLRIFRHKVQGRRPSQLASGWKALASGLEKGAKGQS